MRGRASRGAWRCAAAAVALLVAGAAGAQFPPAPDFLFMASLRGPVAAEAPSPGEWGFSTTLSYFNTWHYTWHVGSIHRHLDRLGEAITPEEIAYLESFWGQEDIHQVDVEGWRVDAVVSRRVWRDLTLTVTVPWVEVGRPNWDMIAEEFHGAIGAKNMRRDWFRRGRTLLFVHVPDGRRVEAHDELEGSGVGDVTLALAAPLGAWLGGEHRLAFAIEAPTGEQGTLRGSGGWDAALQWLGTWRVGRTRLDGVAGYTRLDPDGSWLSLQRRDTWGAGGAAAIPVGARTDLLLSLRVDSSPVERLGELSRNTGFWTVGVQRTVGRGHLAFRVGENLMGVVPDWTFHLGYAASFGSGGGR